MFLVIIAGLETQSETYDTTTLPSRKPISLAAGSLLKRFSNYFVYIKLPNLLYESGTPMYLNKTQILRSSTLFRGV